MHSKLSKSSSVYILYSIIIILIIRFILTGIIPLLDKTESRYAEIARIMQETGEWAVLQIDYGIPFWAKPPLSTWLSASSFQLFGVSELTARLPFFILCIVLLIILGKFVKKAGHYFYLPAFILLTTPEFLLHAGVVSTDTALCFCITLIMISFWKSFNTEKKSFWNYLFFIGLGLGLLSKGPLVLVLVGPPLFIWLLVQKVTFKDIFTKLPWVLGLLITGLIAVPWYIIVENKSPGFIDYFIVGEHFNRFLVSRWKGDLYGSGHSQPKGMIWVFLLGFAFPWIQVVLLKLWKTRKTFFKDKWVLFLTLWLFWTPLFFTMSTNILHTYILPVTIPLALLVVHWWNDFKSKKLLLRIGTIFPILVFIATVIFISSGEKLESYLNTDKYIIESANSLEKEVPIYYWKNKTYSSQFYAKGKVQNITNVNELDSIYKKTSEFLMIVKNKKLKDIPLRITSKMIKINSSKKATIYHIKK